ncbi:proline-rich protein [Mycena polygramma]|nr:proline-rich protein [Mycena polygramma]
MWTITAAFDGAVQDGDTPQKTKLLKTDKSYQLGRKDTPLVLHGKKISRNHGTFAVDKFEVANVSDPTFCPRLNYTNTAKNIVIQRGDEVHPVNPGADFELADGDVMAVASNFLITVRWQPVCCYQQTARAKSNTLLTSCASLGLHLVHKPVQHITHHLTSTYAATTIHALSLVSAAVFVKPQWLDEVVRLGNLPLNSDPSTGVSLEQHFNLPAVPKYRPTFGPDLPSGQKTISVWEPNEARLKLFSSYRFFCIGEAKRQIDSELRELLTRGSARIEVFDVAEGSDKFRGALVRGKAKLKQSVVLIADQKACEAAVGDKWKNIVEQAKIFGLDFFTHQDIIQAVLHADASVFESSAAPAEDRAPSSSPLPDFVPNTHPDEGSLVPESEEPEPEPEPEPVPPPRKLTRRVSSRQASQEPKPAEDAPAPARKPLKRRAQATGLPILTGLDDPSILLNNLPDTSVVAPPAVHDTPSKPRSRLKRRVGVSAPAENVETLISNAIMSGAGVDPETGEEPPLKKFKALFEASDPRRSGAESFVQESGAFDEDDLILMASVGSQTQLESQTQGGSKRSGRSGNSAAALRAVPEEEEEESQLPVGDSNAADGGKKRKERSFDRDDVEMAGVEDALNPASGSGAGSGPAAKKRAVAGNAVERAAPKPPSAAPQLAGKSASKVAAAPSKTAGTKGAAAGAAPGKPDTDSVFLKAIASTKRGKKTEDDFDRDFNKLKISKTDLRGDDAEPRPDWELIDTFGDESNLRGNFMVIHDLEVYKVDHEPRKRAVGTDPRWEGKPDFKKFKKLNNTAAPRKKIIDLVISEDNDSGGGPNYWKRAASPANSDDDFGPTQKRETQPTTRATHAPAKASRAKTQSKTQAVIIDDDSEDDVRVVPKEKAKRSKPPSKAEPPPKKRTTRGTSKAPDAPAALFLDDSDSDKMDEDEPARGGTLDEDDFDAGQTLQSSADAPASTRRSSRMPPATKRKAIIVDDDSDDGAVFTGFGKKKARR